MTKPTIRRGDKGAQVEELQNRLHSYGYLKNPISHGVKAGCHGLPGPDWTLSRRYLRA
jgi:hypothetical protein